MESTELSTGWFFLSGLCYLCYTHCILKMWSTDVKDLPQTFSQCCHISSWATRPKKSGCSRSGPPQVSTTCRREPANQIRPNTTSIWPSSCQNMAKKKRRNIYCTTNDTWWMSQINSEFSWKIPALILTSYLYKVKLVSVPFFLWQRVRIIENTCWKGVMRAEVTLVGHLNW